MTRHPAKSATARTRNSPWRRSQLPLRFHLELLEDRCVPAVIGYYEMGSGQGNPNQAPPIVAAGDTPVQLFGLTAADLAGIDVLDVQNPNNFAYGLDYTSHLADIQNAV